jgi:hypothetical protein
MRNFSKHWWFLLADALSAINSCSDFRAWYMAWSPRYQYVWWRTIHYGMVKDIKNHVKSNQILCLQAKPHWIRMPCNGQNKGVWNFSSLTSFGILTLSYFDAKWYCMLILLWNIYTGTNQWLMEPCSRNFFHSKTDPCHHGKNPKNRSK